jgi:hypothetical protein
MTVEIQAGKDRAAGVGYDPSGFFAALRMTAKTYCRSGSRGNDDG